MAPLLLTALLAAAKPQVDLKANRSVVVLPATPSPARVTFTLRVRDAGEEDYYCPRIEWEWEDGTHSSEESDCPPFEEARTDDHDRRYSRTREFWDPGRHRITARLFKGDRLVRKADVTVEVRGEAFPDRFRER